MEWQQLVGFYHVAQSGSFTKAAAATWRTQSALSQQLKALEEELGCPLLERIGKRRLELTPAGEKLLAFARLVFAKHEELLEDLAEIKRAPRGRLRLAAPLTTLLHLLPDFLQEYRRLYPHVQLAMLDRPQEAVLALVKNGEVDFGFARQSIVPGDLRVWPWQPVQTVLLTPPDHPLAAAGRVSLADIARYPLILPPADLRYAGRERLAELFFQHGLSHTVALESANVELSYRYVELGLGLAFATLAGDVAYWRHRRLAFIPLEDYFPGDYLAIVARGDKTLSAYKTAFLEMLLAGAPPPPTR